MREVVAALIVICCASASAQKMQVRVLDRQDKEEKLQLRGGLQQCRSQQNLSSSWRGTHPSAS